MKTVKLVVYGTLMTGEGNHGLCANAVNISKPPARYILNSD